MVAYWLAQWRSMEEYNITIPTITNKTEKMRKKRTGEQRFIVFLFRSWKMGWFSIRVRRAKSSERFRIFQKRIQQSCTERAPVQFLLEILSVSGLLSYLQESTQTSSSGIRVSFLVTSAHDACVTSTHTYVLKIRSSYLRTNLQTVKLKLRMQSKKTSRMMSSQKRPKDRSSHISHPSINK